MTSMSDLTQKARDNVGACIAMILFSVIAVAIRLSLKAKMRHRLITADYLCIAALLIFGGYCGAIIYFPFHVSLFDGFDGDPSQSPDEFTNLLKYAYAAEILFTLIITLAKLSILAFYWSVFAVDKIMKRVIQGTFVMSIVWWIVATLIIIFQCKPISAYWEKYAYPPYCLETPKLLLGLEVTNLFFDVWVLLIPVSVVRKLKLPSHKKWSVLGIFLMGAFVCITSIVRIRYIWTPPNTVHDFEFAPTMMWSTLQLGTAIICSCLPTFGPLFSGVGKAGHRARGWYVSFRTHGGGNSGPRYKMEDSNKSASGRNWTDVVGQDTFQPTTKSWAMRDNDSTESALPLEPLCPGQIRVKRGVEVS